MKESNLFQSSIITVIVSVRPINPDIPKISPKECAEGQWMEQAKKSK